MNHELIICGKCHRLLPAEHFRRCSGLPDRYCKDCRNAYMRYYRKGGVALDRQQQTVAAATPPLITTTTDPVLRRQLIRQAVETVRRRVLHKRQLLIEREYASQK